MESVEEWCCLWLLKLRQEENGKYRVQSPGFAVSPCDMTDRRDTAKPGLWTGPWTGLWTGLVTTITGFPAIT